MPAAAEELDYMRLLLGDDGDTLLFTDDQLNMAYDMFGSRWCRAAAFLARRNVTTRATQFTITKSIGDTSVTKSDPSQHWADQAKAIDAFCDQVADLPTEMSFGLSASASGVTREAVFDLWMHVNPEAHSQAAQLLY